MFIHVYIYIMKHKLLLDIGTPGVKDTVTINRFKAINANLDFNNKEPMLNRSEEKIDS